MQFKYNKYLLENMIFFSFKQNNLTQTLINTVVLIYTIYKSYMITMIMNFNKC